MKQFLMSIRYRLNSTFNNSNRQFVPTIQSLNEQQKIELLRMIHTGDTSEETSSL